MTGAPPETSGDRAAGGRSWLWLLAGAALMPFTQFQTVVPLAAWIAPIFLLRFVRTRPALLALPALMLALYASTAISLRGVFPGPLVFIFSLGGVAGAVCYALDRWLAKRLPGPLGTLVFPSAVVAVDWLFGQSPFGTLGSIAYSQFGNAPLTQVVSISGIWGLAFLIAWCAPVVNVIWERGPDGVALRRILLPYAAVLGAALAFGGFRVAFSERGEPSVRVAAIASSRASRESLSLPSWSTLAFADDGDRAEARAQFAPIAEELLARSRDQARAGARIVLWAEADALVLEEDEPALLERASDLARQEGIYLQMGLLVALRTDRFPWAENRAVLVDPEGRVAWDYSKTFHPLGDAHIFAPGPGDVPVVETPHGRLATVICFDADFPALVRRAGKARADILLVPARDWRPIHTLHARAAAFRAIENGFSLVRAAGDGLSLAVDPEGRVLAAADSFAADPMTLTATVPARGRPTLYRRIGDAAAYGCLIALALLAGYALIRPRAGR